MAQKKDTSIDDIAEAIAMLATNIDERFDQVDERFEAVDRRFDGVDARFEAIDERFEAIDSRFDGMDARFNSVERRLDELSVQQREMRDWLEKIDASVSGLTSDIAEIYDRILVLEKQAPLDQKAHTELQDNINKLFDWAKLVSQKTGVKLPKI